MEKFKVCLWAKLKASSFTITDNLNHTEIPIDPTGSWLTDRAGYPGNSLQHATI
jgi:hypothetical protein